MPIKMGALVQSVVIGDTVYVGGGFAGNDRDRCTMMKLEHYQWTKLPEYTAKYFAMTSLANRLVLYIAACQRLRREVHPVGVSSGRAVSGFPMRK